jgi:hypothetical protein
LGLPVVPEVNASSAMSSPAVGQAGKLPLLRAAIASSEVVALGIGDIEGHDAAQHRVAGLGLRQFVLQLRITQCGHRPAPCR